MTKQILVICFGRDAFGRAMRPRHIATHPTWHVPNFWFFRLIANLLLNFSGRRRRFSFGVVFLQSTDTVDSNNNIFGFYFGVTFGPVDADNVRKSTRHSGGHDIVQQQRYSILRTFEVLAMKFIKYKKTSHLIFFPLRHLKVFNSKCTEVLL